MTEKDSRLAELCRRNGFDGVLLRRRSNIAWATDGADVHCDLFTDLGVAAALWTPLRKVILTDTIESPRLADEEFAPALGREDWEIVTRDWWQPGPLVPDGLVPPHARLGADFPDDIVTELRAPLTLAEQARARALGADAARIMDLVMRDINKGDSEHAIAADLTGRLQREGIFARVLLVAADGRIAAYRHPIPTSRRVEKTAMVALCAQRAGLIVSITRLVSFGPLPDDLRRRHDAVCAVDAALHGATRPGARWCDLLAVAQRVYAKEGFPDEWRRHHQGGPMGYECRDFKATPTETRAVVAGQLVGWNPSIAGTKSEDTILTTPDGPPEVLTAMSGWPINDRAPGARPDILVRP